MRRLLAIAMTVAGCSPASSTLGEEGVGELAYADDWRSCEADCSLAVPMAAGATSWVRIVNLHALGEVSLRSDDPEVVAVGATASGEHFRLVAARAGTARLELVDRSGVVIDRVPLAVRDIARVEVTTALEEPVRISGGVSLAISSFDAAGVRLRGFGALRYETTDNLEVRARSLGDREGSVVSTTFGDDHVDAEIAEVVAVGEEGPGRLDIVPPTGEGLSIDFDVRARELPEVLSIDLAHRVEDNVAIVTAEIVLADPEATACCEWSTEPADAPVAFNAPECTSVRAVSMTPDAEQDVTIVCTANGVVASERVHLLVQPDPTLPPPEE